MDQSSECDRDVNNEIPPLGPGELSKVKEELVDHLMTLDNKECSTESGEQELKSGRALVYRLFDKHEDDTATCKICFKVLKASLGWYYYLHNFFQNYTFIGSPYRFPQIY